MQWFYAAEGKQVGPVEEPELRTLYRQGLLTLEALVWCPAFPDWQPLHTVLDRIDPAAPPPLSGLFSQCLECGRTFPPEQVLRYGDLAVCAHCKPVFLRRIKQGTLPEVDDIYAGFGPRFFAKVIDWITLGILQNTLYFAFYENDFSQFAKPEGMLVGMFMWLFNISLLLAFNTFFIARFAATPGKMALGLQVLDADGARPGIGLALGRSAAEFVSMFTLYIGYLVVLFDPQRRALHDYICNTRVVRDTPVSVMHEV